MTDALDQVLAYIQRGAEGGILFLVGLYLGNRIELGRARRLEYNAAIAPVRARFVQNRDHPTPNNQFGISPAEHDVINGYLSGWKRRCLRRAIERYEQCREQQMRNSEFGQPLYADANAVRDRINELLALLKPR